LQDEIGYLSNASFLGGYKVDGSSSYHGGYSLFLAPLFSLIEDPFVIWQGVIFTNCLFAGLGFYLLFVTADILFKEASELQIKTAFLITIFYPSWISMCGYAFPSTILMTFFMISIVTLLKIKAGATNSLILISHSFFTAFMFWIHPTGIVPVIASFIVLSWEGIREHKYRAPVIHGLIMGILCLIAKKYFHPYIINGMTPEGFSPLLHYPDLKLLAMSLLSPEFLGRTLVRAAGQLSYLLISTFAIIGVGIYRGICISREGSLRYSINGNNDPQSGHHNTQVAEARTYRFILLTVAGNIVMSALMFVFVQDFNLDTWIHGRYVEPFILLLFFAGVISLEIDDWKIPGSTIHKLKFAAFPLFVLIFSGLSIDFLRNVENKTMNFINIPGFWPLPVSSLFIDTVPTIMIFILFGIGGLCLFTYLPTKAKKALIILVFVKLSLIQYDWHLLLYYQTANPSSFLEFVKDRLNKGQTIGVEPDIFEKLPKIYEWDRCKMYSFYFYDYNYQRLAFKQWQSQKEAAFYITRNLDAFISNQSGRIIGKERTSGLFLIGTKDIAPLTDEERTKWDNAVLWTKDDEF
jgi:hypothetical protein